MISKIRTILHNPLRLGAGKYSLLSLSRITETIEFYSHHFSSLRKRKQINFEKAAQLNYKAQIKAAAQKDLTCPFLNLLAKLSWLRLP